MIRKVLIAVMAVAGLVALATSGSAHADLESSVPAAGSTVASAPLTLDLTFTEEVAGDGVTARVIGPGGDEVQAGTAELDLNDPERRHVTLSLQANLPDGHFTVEWQTTSNLDDHAGSGSFGFTVGAPAGSPAASPAVSPVASPGAGTPVGTLEAVASSVQAEPTLDPANGNPLGTEDGDFDGRAFGLSIGAGLIGVAAIVVFWRVVRPRNPAFGARARR